jgi:hypothetical protein
VFTERKRLRWGHTPNLSRIGSADATDRNAVREDRVQLNGPEGKKGEKWIPVATIARRRQCGERAAGIMVTLVAPDSPIHRRAIHSAAPSPWFVRP